VVVLALGIGANAAIVSLVNAFLLKPLRIHKAEELVGLYSRDTRKPDSYQAFSYPNFVDLRGKAACSPAWRRTIWRWWDSPKATPRAVFSPTWSRLTTSTPWASRCGAGACLPPKRNAQAPLRW